MSAHQIQTFWSVSNSGDCCLLPWLQCEQEVLAAKAAGPNGFMMWMCHNFSKQTTNITILGI